MSISHSSFADCTVCGAPIIWAKTKNCRRCDHDRDGHRADGGECLAYMKGTLIKCQCHGFEAKKIPLDRASIPFEKGALRYVDHETVTVDQREVEKGVYFRTHWATCENVDAVRRESGRRVQ